MFISQSSFRTEVKNLKPSVILVGVAESYNSEIFEKQQDLLIYLPPEL